MTIEYDISGETLVSLKEGHKLPSPKHPPTYRQLVRWTTDGLMLPIHPERPVIVLESYQDGGDVYTSVEAYLRFHEKRNAIRQEAISQRARRRMNKEKL